MWGGGVLAMIVSGMGVALILGFGGLLTETGISRFNLVVLGLNFVCGAGVWYYGTYRERKDNRIAVEQAIGQTEARVIRSESDKVVKLLMPHGLVAHRLANGAIDRITPILKADDKS